MISKEAKEKWTATKNQWFFKSARYAFEELLNIIRSVRDGVVLMPGYIGQSVREGSGVFDPIRHTKTRYASSFAVFPQHCFGNSGSFFCHTDF